MNEILVRRGVKVKLCSGNGHSTELELNPLSCSIEKLGVLLLACKANVFIGFSVLAPCPNHHAKHPTRSILSPTCIKPNGNAYYAGFMYITTINTVFQITFKGRVPKRNFEGPIHVDIPTPSQVYHLFCWVRWPAFSGFDLRPLSYLEH